MIWGCGSCVVSLGLFSFLCGGFEGLGDGVGWVGEWWVGVWWSVHTRVSRRLLDNKINESKHE